MVEISPSSLKLAKPGLRESFEKAISFCRFRYVDIASKDDEVDIKPWVNSEQTVVFEMRRPSVNDIAYLLCSLSKLWPDNVEYMNSNGESYIVFFMEFGE